jgi:DNA-binding HxlR family transcriptional regulator
MEKETDEYCEKIFMVLAIIGKTRFNKLHQKLPKLGAKMSKPTLIIHLNHLVEKGIIQRNEEGKQKVSYELNWKRLKQLRKFKKANQIAIDQVRNKKMFKSMNSHQQIIFTTAMLTIAELFYLKLTILNTLEPENKLQNYYSYTIIRKLFNMYATYLLDSCKDSKENSQKIIHSIDKDIKTLTETCFELFPKDTQQKTKKDVPSKNATLKTVLLKRRKTTKTTT